MTNVFFGFATGSKTDTGCLRTHNEDSLLTLPNAGLWVVADGMGGHDAGAFASQPIDEEVSSIGLPSAAAEQEARFMERLFRANSRILDHSDALGGSTVGATVVALLIFENTFNCIWSGDSRIYLHRNGTLSQQTVDHTEVRELLAAGSISEEEARDWPRRNVITRAVGVSPEPQCDEARGHVYNGDLFLLCSDGLYEHMEDDEIAQMLAAHGDPQAACDALIAETIDRGARDNVTVVVVRCDELPEPEPED